MSAAQILVGLGQYSFWGSSATFDFLEAMESLLSDEIDSSRPIRILLVQASDIRHVLTTIANKFRKQIHRPIEFYLLDSPMEVLARNILLLEIILDFDIPIRQRSNIILEIFGNVKVQERTSNYIEELASQLRNLVALGKGRLEHLIDFSMMKYKEKDILEECFKSYIASTFPFDIDHYRDYRLRSYYGDRYDSREALADWDYHEAIRSRASIIHIRQYKDWRKTGIAFEFGDQQYTHPNRTLMAYAEGYIKQGKDKGLKKEVKGYWGDMINSPYYSFGVDCETNNAHSAGLFEIVNKNTGSEQHRHHTVEVALLNILAALYQIESRQVYEMKVAHDIFSGLGEKASSDSLIHEKATIEELEDEDLPIDEPITNQAESEESEDENNMKKRAINILETFQNVKIIPVLGPINEKLFKAKFDGYFDAVFLSAKYAQLANDESFHKLLTPHHALIAIETAKFYQPLAKAEQKQEFVRKIEEYCSNHHLHRIPAPVRRRHRDEADLEDDVIFFRNSM